jgi:deoxyribose-phosphate aldolase
MEEIHATTHDDYGLKASGCLHSLEKFNTLFGLRLAHTLFGATEEVSLLLQKKDIAIYSGSTVSSRQSKGLLHKAAFR